MKSINTLPPVVMQIIFGTLATELGRSSGSALSQRLQDAATVKFLRLLLLAAVQYLCTVKRSRTIIPILERFNGVYIGYHFSL